MTNRLLRTAYGVLGTPAFGAVIVPLCGCIIAAPTLPMRREIGRLGVKLAMLVAGAPIRVLGLENLPPGPSVVVANHSSYLDGLVLTAALPRRFTFLVQSGAAQWPLAGPTITRMGVSYVNRGSAREAAAATRELIRRITEGESFAIFAEGTFKPEPGLLDFQNGAFMIAARAGVPVVPVAIRGMRSVLGEHDRLLRPGRVEIEVLPAVSANSDSKESLLAIKQCVRAAILARCGEPDAHTPVA